MLFRCNHWKKRKPYREFQIFIDDKEVVLAENENHNNLHSGPDGFEKKLWGVKEISQEKNSVDFFRISPDGENGFPGEFSIVVKYEFTEENELKIFTEDALMQLPLPI